MFINRMQFYSLCDRNALVLKTPRKELSKRYRSYLCVVMDRWTYAVYFWHPISY